MAVISNIEWKIEAAWIAALTDNSDLSSATIRRHMDASADVIYPAVTVHCSGSSQPTEWAGATGYDTAFVELMAMTYRADDSTGSACAALLGAIRDSCRDNKLIPLLNGISGLTVYAARIEGTSLIDDEEMVRRRSLTVRCHATCSDVPDEESSSSSSCSMNSSSSLSGTSVSTSSASSSSSSSTVAGETSSSQSSTSESSEQSYSSTTESSQSSTSESTLRDQSSSLSCSSVSSGSSKSSSSTLAGNTSSSTSTASTTSASSTSESSAQTYSTTSVSSQSSTSESS